MENDLIFAFTLFDYQTYRPCAQNGNRNPRGAEQEIPAYEIVKGDLLIVKAGTAIAVDGIITEGYGAIDQVAIIGESIPVDKKQVDKV